MLARWPCCLVLALSTHRSHATRCAAEAHRLTPHCSRSRRLLLGSAPDGGTARVAVAGVWVPDASGGAATKWGDRGGGGAAAANFATSACALARVAPGLPYLLLTYEVSAEAQRELCARGEAHVLDAGVDLSPFWRPMHNASEATRTGRLVASAAGQQQLGGQRRGWATYYKFALWNLTCFFDALVALDGDAVLLADPRPALARHRRDAALVATRESHGGFVGLNTHIMLLRPNRSVARALLLKAEAGDYLVTTNTEQDVLECYFCIAGSSTACSTRRSGDEGRVGFRWQYDGMGSVRALAPSRPFPGARDDPHSGGLPLHRHRGVDWAWVRHKFNCSA